MTMSRRHTSLVPPNGISPEIRIMDSTDTKRSEQHTTKSMVSSDSSTIYRKLRRRKGHGSRTRMGLTSCPSSFISRKGTTATSLLLLLLVLLLAVENKAAAAAAFLNGANPSNSKASTTRKTTKAASPPPSSPKNERYAFLSKSRDRYFTATGILPPLSPSSNPEKQKEALLSPLPPNPFSESDEEKNKEQEISVTYTNDPNKVDEWLCRNVPYDGCFLGFDIERLPETRSEHPHATDRHAFAHAAVVQLATSTACLVVQLVDASCDDGIATPKTHHPRHSNACARILRPVLEDPSIIKSGCAIDEDLVWLHELWDKQNHNRQHDGQNNAANGKTPKKNASKKNQRKNPHPPKGKVAFKKVSHHRHSNTRVPSLQARSRFDLGCVVLPKNHSVSDNTNVLDDKKFKANKTDMITDQQHYKIVAKRTTTISNKSGLQGLCEFVLGVDLPKERNTCASDWTRFPLSDEQITYAARDAWAGAAIATKLASMDVESINTNLSDNSKTSSSSSSVFSRPNLIRVLRRAETPLPQLAQRHRQRKEAKSELHNLLYPYSRNLFHNQHNHRCHQEHQTQQPDQSSTTPTAQKCSSSNSTTIDVAALFPEYPLSSRRTLANTAQKQQQLMEKSLPKQIRNRSIILRQTVNAKVIDHKIVFEVLDLVNAAKNNNVPAKVSPYKNKPKQRHYRGRKRRTHGGQEANSSENRR